MSAERGPFICYVRTSFYRMRIVLIHQDPDRTFYDFSLHADLFRSRRHFNYYGPTSIPRTRTSELVLVSALCSRADIFLFTV